MRRSQKADTSHQSSVSAQPHGPRREGRQSWKARSSFLWLLTVLDAQGSQSISARKTSWDVIISNPPFAPCTVAAPGANSVTEEGKTGLRADPCQPPGAGCEIKDVAGEHAASTQSILNTFLLLLGTLIPLTIFRVHNYFSYADLVSLKR